MEQNREPRDKLKSSRSINIWQRRQEHKMEQKQPLQQMVWEIWTATWKKMNLDHQLMPYTKINSRWIEDWNISHNTIKILEENIGKKISDIPCSNIFSNMSPRARDIKEWINKWDLIKIKTFCMAKENSTKLQREPTVWENIFANDTSDKGPVSYTHLTLPTSKPKCRSRWSP